MDQNIPHSGSLYLPVTMHTPVGPSKTMIRYKNISHWAICLLSSYTPQVCVKEHLWQTDVHLDFIYLVRPEMTNIPSIAGQI